MGTILSMQIKQHLDSKVITVHGINHGMILSALHWVLHGLPLPINTKLRFLILQGTKLKASHLIDKFLQLKATKICL